MFKMLKTVFLCALLAGAMAAPLRAEDNTAELDAKADLALNSLYQNSPKAKELSERAISVLVFPTILKGGLIVGGQYGKGALRKQGKSVGYYSSAAGSYGLQAGVQSFGYALLLMSDKAVAELDSADGWELGAGPSVVLVDEGVAASLTTRTADADVYAFVFDQKGLMAGMALQGTKITRLKRP